MEKSSEVFGTLHEIKDDIAPGAMEGYAIKGVKSIEEYLGKHVAFLAYLDEVEPEAAPHDSVRLDSASINVD